MKKTCSVGCTSFLVGYFDYRSINVIPSTINSIAKVNSENIV
ncbi:hypothetical protein [Bacillus cereus]|nr:hypothetical protein [Bacillus cereus]